MPALLHLDAGKPRGTGQGTRIEAAGTALRNIRRDPAGEKLLAGTARAEPLYGIRREDDERADCDHLAEFAVLGRGQHDHHSRHRRRRHRRRQFRVEQAAVDRRTVRGHQLSGSGLRSAFGDCPHDWSAPGRARRRASGARDVRDDPRNRRRAGRDRG